MEWLLVIFAYLLGSVPSGVVVARIMGGADPRSGGSGNIGATNVLRTLGKKAAVATLAGDFVKGVIPVVIAIALLPETSPYLYLTAAAAILGHDFSFLLAFKGHGPVKVVTCIAIYIGGCNIRGSKASDYSG